MAELKTEGLLAAVIDHPANEYYPNQKFGDFDTDYDAEASDYPWNTLGNCCICGRLEVFLTFL
jgi:hypothetical protein